MTTKSPARPSLEISDLTVRFGGVTAVSEVDLSVGEGELVGLLGPNGAGKTTFVDAISGFVAHSGRIVCSGVPVQNLAPHRRLAAGISRTWQSAELFEDLTVAQNLEVAYRPSATGARGDVGIAQIDASGLLEMVGLAHVAGRPAGSLPMGHQRFVGIARALATHPRYLLLDEPGAGLDPDEVASLAELVRSIAALGIGVLLIDHDTSLVFSIADRVAVLEFGSLIANGPPDEVRADRAVIAAYLGEPA